MAKINDREYNKTIREFPGSIRVKELTVNGNDISDYYRQIDIFESIYSPTMSARLTLFDTTNLIKKIPIIGEEKVVIHIDDGVEEFKHEFRCHKISDRKNPEHGVLSYVLHLITPERVEDSIKKVSKSYNKKKLEENVKDILTSKDYLGSSKELITGDTEYPECLVIPNWSPIYAISWLGSRALAKEAKYKGSDFLFYETMDGFKWVSLDNLLDDTQNKPYATLSYDPLRPTNDGLTRYDSRGKEDLLRFEDWNVVNTTDTLQNSFLGMYGNSIRIIDIVETEFKDHDYSYIKKFYDSHHLDGAEGFSAKPLSSLKFSATEHPEAQHRVRVKHKGLHDNEVEEALDYDKWLPNKVSKRQQLQNFKVQGTLPGHIGLTAGMIVNFYFPNPEDISVNSTPGFDPSYSGQYLVTACRRMIQRNKFVLQLELIKDSRGQDPNDIVSI